MEDRVTRLEVQVESVHSKIDDMADDVKDIRDRLFDMTDKTARMDERFPKKSTAIITGLATVFATIVNYIVQQMPR